MKNLLIILVVLGLVLSSVSMATAFNNRQEFFMHLFGKEQGDLKTLVETGQGWCLVAVQHATIESNTLTWKDKCYGNDYWVKRAKQAEALRQQGHIANW